MTVEVTDDLKAAVNTATSTMWPRYARWAGREDMAQHLWVWLLTHEETVQRLEPGQLAWRLRTTAERYGRREKAARAGYDVVDEYFYSLPKLLRLCYDAFDSEATPPSESYRADELYSEWVTEVSDVRAALRRKVFPLRHYGVLRELVQEGRRNEDDPEVKAALRALQRQLGGSRPK